MAVMWVGHWVDQMVAAMADHLAEKKAGQMVVRLVA